MPYRALLAALLLAAACSTAAFGVDRKGYPPCQAYQSIGAAHMDADGVITLFIHALPPGPIGEGELRYAPDDPRYQEIVTHLGGIKPGETKNVRPWC
jgi:hypothetical protein